MKTLDEVIKAMENCYGSDAECCDKCSYTIEVTGHGVICRKCDLEDDALHYLKELRDMTDIPMEYFENGGTSQEIVCPKCHSEFVILPEANNPLTWDELQQMEGNPVWVVVDGKERWRIIREVTNEHLILESGLPLHKCWMNHPDGWQAYRKERKNVQS